MTGGQGFKDGVQVTTGFDSKREQCITVVADIIKTPSQING
jgi:hypothetical protein